MNKLMKAWSEAAMTEALVALYRSQMGLLHVDISIVRAALNFDKLSDLEHERMEEDIKISTASVAELVHRIYMLEVNQNAWGNNDNITH